MEILLYLQGSALLPHTCPPASKILAKAPTFSHVGWHRTHLCFPPTLHNQAPQMISSLTDHLLFWRHMFWCFFLKDRIPLFSEPSNSFLKNLLSFELHLYCQPRSPQRAQCCWERSVPQGAHRALTLTEEGGAPPGLVTPAVLPRLPLPSSQQHWQLLLYVPPNVFKDPNLALKQWKLSV